MGVRYNYLTYILYVIKPDNCYTSFNIPKKDGTNREICAPNKELKDIQKRLAKFLAKQKIQMDSKLSNKEKLVSHGFETDKNIITNAKIHRNKRYVLNIDLKNFFDSFHIGRIIGYFEKNNNFNFPREVAVVIAQLSCYKSKLPQGAPSSPIITNLICQVLDRQLLLLAKKYRVNYTRYADDLTFSTNNKKFVLLYEECVNEIAKIIEKNGFVINQKKTRLIYKDSKQKVTGLIVNKKINIDNDYFKDTKAMAHSLYKNGKFVIDGKEGTIQQLEGRLSFINLLDSYNHINSAERNQRPFNRREVEYQKFLFYKYFLNNDKPLIITEGKTDPLYIKAALKALYNNYHKLIEKKDEKFEYGISFFSKPKTFQYLFKFSQTGGDALQKVFQAYCDNGLYAKCGRMIQKYVIQPKHPIILLLDNESMGKDKPLYKFLKNSGLIKNKKDEISGQLSSRIFDGKNLYAVTIPLVNGKEETEIEDLLDEKTLQTIIDGRTYQSKVKSGDNLHYSKNVLSKYVYDNYKTINFERFKKLFDTIENVLDSYYISLKDCTPK